MPEAVAAYADAKSFAKVLGDTETKALAIAEPGSSIAFTEDVVSNGECEGCTLSA